MNEILEIKKNANVVETPGPNDAQAANREAEVQVVTLGCRLNALESESIRQAARQGGMSRTTVLNTCAVTSEAVRQARQEIRKAKRRNPGHRLIVTGCAAQVEPETFAKMPEVDQVLGNREKLDLLHYVPSNRPLPNNKIVTSDILSSPIQRPIMLNGFQHRTRGFVQIQNGCDHRCTFCIIPYGRGKSRSESFTNIVNAVKAMVDNGHQEVVLTGVDIASYGKELDPQVGLGTLVLKLLDAVPELPRLRLSSLDPAAFDEDLFTAFQDHPRLMPMAHLSIQSLSDLILKRMRRRHLRQDAIELCQRLRQSRKGMIIGADLIAGFPTEDEEQFNRTLAGLKEAHISLAHVFPYSARKGTPAARMPQVQAEQIKIRAQMIRDDCSWRLSDDMQSMIGSSQRILMENATSGKTENFLPAVLETPSSTCGEGEIIRATVVDATKGQLLIETQSGDL